MKQGELDKKDVSSVAEMTKPYKIFLEDLTERENAACLVVVGRSILKHRRDTGHNDVIFSNIGSF